MTRLPVGVSGAGAGIHVFPVILRGAPVPPPMAYVPLEPRTDYRGAGDASAGTGGVRLC